MLSWQSLEVTSNRNKKCTVPHPEIYLSCCYLLILAFQTNISKKAIILSSRNPNQIIGNTWCWFTYKKLLWSIRRGSKIFAVPGMSENVPPLKLIYYILYSRFMAQDYKGTWQKCQVQLVLLAVWYLLDIFKVVNSLSTNWPTQSLGNVSGFKGPYSYSELLGSWMLNIVRYLTN
jgi:hypothetical protein